MEDLAHGPSYDVELVESELRQNTDMLPDSAAARADGRRVILSSCYDNVTLQQPNFFQHQFRVGACNENIIKFPSFVNIFKKEWYL